MLLAQFLCLSFFVKGSVANPLLRGSLPNQPLANPYNDGPVANQRTVAVPHNVDRGTRVIGLSGPAILLSTQHSFAFQVNESCQCVTTRHSLSTYVAQSITLRLRVANNGQGAAQGDLLEYRVVVMGMPYANTHTGTVQHTAFTDTLVTGLEHISLNEPISDVTYELMQQTYMVDSPFRLLEIVDTNPKQTFCQLRTNVPDLSHYSGLQILTIVARSIHNLDLVFPIAVEVDVTRNNAAGEPVFDSKYYEISLASDSPVHSSILRVSAAAQSPVAFSLGDDHQELPFAIQSDTGLITFEPHLIKDDLALSYQFFLHARTDLGDASSVPVTIRLVDPQDLDLQLIVPRPRVILSRERRQLKAPFVASIPEDYDINLPLAQRVLLLSSERIRNAPVSDKDSYLTVDQDGTISFSKQPNYELKKEINLVVTVENVQTKEDASQRIEIRILDVDEPPAFLNPVEPYLAVIKRDAPAHFSIYKFIAQDENGDDNEREVEIKQLNNAQADFRVSPDGWVRTVRPGAEYTLGQEYEVLVQAVDTPHNALNQHQTSRVAKLRVVAGERAPQFTLPEYEAKVPENTPIGATIVQVTANSFEHPRGAIFYELSSGSDQSLVSRSVLQFGHKDQYSTSFDQSFQNNPRSRQLFTIDANSGEVQLNGRIDYDDPKEQQVFNLQVIAREPSLGLYSSVPLIVRVEDVNDNAPRFQQPLYSATISEDYALHVPILKLSCYDLDDGPNAKLRFVTDDDHFAVNSLGEITAIQPLDADQNGTGYHIYTFRVTAIDQPLDSAASKNASAKVHIRTENVDDERPYFQPTNAYVGYVSEEARGNTPIVTIQAQDKDRDQVFYHFQQFPGGPLTQEWDDLFEIDKDTGLIKLQANTLASEHLSEEYYNLTVIAVDDGSCCKRQPHSINRADHYSQATVVVSVTDVNNHKPVFDRCEEYSQMAEIVEGRHTDKHTIIKVRATDEDSHLNGQVMYSLFYPQNQARKPFDIDAMTGDLRPSEYVLFDREQHPFEDVTVKATDRGDRPLIGFCQFTVKVLDINDNQPQFDRASYETSIYRMTDVGRSVVTVFADDIDSPPNANVTYKLQSDPSAGPLSVNDITFFHMEPGSGEIILQKPLPNDREKFRFLVVASDNGQPKARETMVTVTISIQSSQQSAPEWLPDIRCKDKIEVYETTAINSILFTCSAQSPDNKDHPISYSMANGAKSSTNADGDFREFQAKFDGSKLDYVILKNLKGLDYENTQEYNLTLTATDIVTTMSTDKLVQIVVQDTNDEVPRFSMDNFVGSVQEEKSPRPGDPAVMIVQARDDDRPNTPGSRIRYELLDGPARALFRMDGETGEIFAMQSFDREKNDSFILDVQASDSIQSDLPGTNGPNKVIMKVQINVEDINDNKPYFNRTAYFGEVSEDAQENQNVLTVKAHDKDKNSKLVYRLEHDSYATGEDRTSAFGVRANSGTIFVKERLDYETRQTYKMTLVVMDGVQEARTQVLINVTDVNDNAPEFVHPLYQTTIEEEDPAFPKTLMTVSATDLDKGDASRNIIYRLDGQGTEEFFKIDERTGVIQVVNKLDRDEPNGAPVWHFIAQAIDDGGQGLIGYADVKVTLTDINDNEPHFISEPIGYIEENRQPNSASEGIFVMQVRAVDYDDKNTGNADVTYSIRRNKEIDKKDVFTIDRHSGKLFANRAFDRENPTEAKFELEVDATDGGVTPLFKSQKITIQVVDLNDNAPFFEPGTYSGMVSESAIRESPVLTVSAKDPDNAAEDNVLQYELVPLDGSVGTKYFYMSTDADHDGGQVGVLRIKQPLDFEDVSQQQAMQMRVRVYDGRYTAETDIQVQVLDENDTPPTITNWDRPVTIKENAKEGDLLLQLITTDPDSEDDPSVNPDCFTYRINRASDNERMFSVGQHTGTLTVSGQLDRETVSRYRLDVEVADSQGSTDSIGLIVNVEDVNDNAPRFEPDTVTIMENKQPGQPGTSVTVQVIDDDEPQNGAPFQFRRTDQYTDLFDMEWDPRTNQVTVRSKKMLDREADGQLGKEFKLGAELTDSGLERTQTQLRTLTVVVGDEPDNPMFDGTKQVHVYKYELHNLPQLFLVGRVYVEDKDDWDYSTKQYTIAEDSSDMFQLQVGDPGMLQLRGQGIQPGNTYTVKVKVVNKLDPSDNAMGTVRVFIEPLPPAAMDNSGSIRIMGLTAEQFIGFEGQEKSAKDRFTESMAQYLNVPKDNVKVFSIMNNYRNYTNPPGPVLDVRFAAHNSPYRQAAQLNGFVQINREQLEAAIGADIIQVNINECYYSKCDQCTTQTVLSTYPTLVNANKTALVGLSTNTTGVCLADCPAPDVPRQCSPGACLNGGICHDTFPGFFCECRGAYFGARCEGISRSFDGSGYIWLPPPQKTCVSENVSIQFMTQQSNAMLVYYGRMYDGELKPTDVYANDFLSMQLVNGRVKVQMNVGRVGCIKNGQNQCLSELSLANGPALNDGLWHTVDFSFVSRRFEVVVDRCRDMVTMADQSRCRGSAVLTGDDERLNVVDPIQIGGVAATTSNEYPVGIMRVPKFTGCIRNLRWNNQLIDLAYPAMSSGSSTGCSATSDKCDVNTLDGPGFCINGECLANMIEPTARCICGPGWTGARCDKRIGWVQFTESSYIRYEKEQPPSERDTNVQLLFVSDSTNGQLLYLTDSSADYMQANVMNRRAAMRLKREGMREAESVTVNDVALGNNQSYWMRLRQYATGLSLSLDELSGEYSVTKPLVFNQPNLNSPVGVKFRPDGIYLGKDDQSSKFSFSGCVGDFRIDDMQLPLEQKDQVDTPGVRILESVNVSPSCPSDILPTCVSTGRTCPNQQICMDLWKGPVCTCPSRMSAVLDINGRLVQCGAAAPVRHLGITTGAVLSILLCILVLMLVVILLVVYTRRSNPVFEEIRPEDDMRENVVNYGVEGGGEEDQDTYNIGPLRKPVLMPDNGKDLPPKHLNGNRNSLNGGVGDVIAERVRDADKDLTAAPYDELRVYDDEGDATSIATLSSLGSRASQVLDWDRKLNEWGPKFQKFADIYGTDPQQQSEPPSGSRQAPPPAPPKPRKPQ